MNGGTADVSRAGGRLRVAIVGAGPAGYFTAQALQRSQQPVVAVDMFEREQVPWGLVRSGVAPDHESIKTVSKVFETVAADDNFRLFANVDVGRDVSREVLVENYDAVVYAIGAQGDRRPDVEGVDLPNVFSARQFVGWYNALPRHASTTPDLSGEHAVVIGNGNVALDVARVLLADTDRFRSTDMADHAIAGLAKSRVRKVTIVGRRGPEHAQFSQSELQEIVSLDSVRVEHALMVNPVGFEDDPQVERRLTTIREAASEERSGAKRVLEFRFHSALAGVSGSSRGVSSASFATSDDIDVLPADLLVYATGFAGEEIPGVPFDKQKMIVPHTAGKVAGTECEYVVGWIKRGPSGVIGINKRCAAETAASLLADAALRPMRDSNTDEVIDAIVRGGAEVVDLHGWLAIHAHEKTLGESQGRPRNKLSSTDSLLEIARKAAKANEVSA